MTLTPRSVSLMVAAALAAGWMGASITQGPSPAQSSRASGGVRPLGVAANAVPQAAALRQRVIASPLPSRGRNPFVYGARVPVPPPSFRDRNDAAMPAPQPSEPLAPPMPIFRLSGVASNLEGGATVFTAILNDNGAMVFAKAGDKLSNGHSVVRVDEMSVTLVDATGVTQTIKLP